MMLVPQEVRVVEIPVAEAADSFLRRTGEKRLKIIQAQRRQQFVGRNVEKLTIPDRLRRNGEPMERPQRRAVFLHIGE